MDSDQQWMQQALRLAASAHEEVPVGALIVRDGKLIAQAVNQVKNRRDPTAHAELLVIQQACSAIQNERLPGAVLYVTLEPCVMCMGAMLQARIARLVFGTRDFRAGAAGSKLNLATGLGAYAPLQVDEGVCQADCAALLQTFFQARRTP